MTDWSGVVTASLMSPVAARGAAHNNHLLKAADRADVGGWSQSPVAIASPVDTGLLRS